MLAAVLLPQVCVSSSSLSFKDMPVPKAPPNSRANLFRLWFFVRERFSLWGPVGSEDKDEEEDDDDERIILIRLGKIPFDLCLVVVVAPSVIFFLFLEMKMVVSLEQFVEFLWIAVTSHKSRLQYIYKSKQYICNSRRRDIIIT